MSKAKDIAKTSGTNTGDQTTVTGNAGTATTLQTARNINGVSFDGSANITINAVDSIARVATSSIGVASGIVPLGSDSKIAATYLPSYVDDVLEFANLAGFPTTGESGKIYVAIDTNKTYRWGSSSYTYITSGAIDSISVTAPISSTGGATPTIGINAASTTVAGSMSAADKTKLDAVNPSALVKTGGTTGQVLSKIDATDFNTQWTTPSTGIGGSASVTISPTAPVSPNVGDQWWNSSEGEMYIYYDDGASPVWVSVGSQGTSVTNLYDNAAPNNVMTASGLQIVDASATDSHFIIKPKGAGGISNTIPTTTYPLGYYCVSFGANIKNSSNYSVAMGAGHTLSASTNYHSAFGSNNTITATSSAFAAGNGNTVGGSNSSAVGQNNNVSAINSFAAGVGNAISGTASVGLGSGNSVSGAYAISAGYNNTTTQKCGVTFGEQLLNKTIGKVALGVYGTIRSATGFYSLQVVTTAFGDPCALTANGSAVLTENNQVAVPTNTVALFEALIIGYSVNTANIYAFKIKGTLFVGGSYNLTTVSNVTVETISNPVSLAIPSATADTTNGAVTLLVPDDNEGGIKYSALVTTTEVRIV